MIRMIENMSPKHDDSENDNEADFYDCDDDGGTADDIDDEGDDNCDGVGVAVTAAVPLGSFTTPDLDSTTRVSQLGVLGCTRIYSTTWVISRVSQCAGNVGHIAAAPVLKMMVPWML